MSRASPEDANAPTVVSGRSSVSDNFAKRADDTAPAHELQVGSRHDSDVATLRGPKRTKPQRLTALADFSARVKVTGGAIPTDFDAMDIAFRGGLRAGKLISINGPPGSGKTMLALNVLDRAERYGHPGLAVMHDEGAEGGAMRFYQMNGGERDELERDDVIGERARAKARELAMRRAIYFAEGDVVLEDAWAEFRAIAGETTPFVVVDSIQRVRCKAALGLDNPRERIDATLDVLKGIARQGAVVILISEMSRAAYRGGKDGNIDPLASGKESGAIEYFVDALIALKPDRNLRGFVDAEIAKNRMGELAEFRLRIDYQTARMTEVAMVDEGARTAARADARQNEVDETILRLARRLPEGIQSKNQATALTKLRRQDVYHAIDRLLDVGDLVKVGKTYRCPGEEVHDAE
jgi:KaiC/GvpD/RAD55 family RecA-like ATPase